MRTEYAIQHKTTGRYIAAPPSAGVLTETDEERDASSWQFMTSAEIQRCFLEEFADAYHVVPVQRPDPSTPTTGESQS